jgi:hypothetical protein
VIWKIHPLVVMYPWWMDGVQMGLSAADEALVASIMQGKNKERRTLADIIY